MRPLQNASNRHTGEGDCVAIGENSFKIVIPAKAGIQTSSRRKPGTRIISDWIPAFAGMTKLLVLCSYAKLSISEA